MRSLLTLLIGTIRFLAAIALGVGAALLVMVAL